MNNSNSEKEISDLFLIEAAEFTDQAERCLLDIEKNPSDEQALDTLFRALHNIKGGAKSFGFSEMSSFSHHMENLFAAVRSGIMIITADVIDLMLICFDRLRKDIALLKENPQALLEHGELCNQLSKIIDNKQPLENAAKINSPKSELPKASPAKIQNRSHEYVRIAQKKIDDLLNNFGEQVILQATLEHIKYDLEQHHDVAIKTINQLSKLTYDLQQTTIALRMINLKQLFSKLERTARDTAIATDKKIELISEGQENEIDKTIADAIGDPLNHMIRNAVDHGIETSEERKRNGKNESGKITLKAFRRGGFFYIIVEDDGRGLDKEKIFKNAVQKGIIKSDAIMSDAEIYNLIYISGLTTRDTASDISGRGVGMDVVNESLRALKGTCEISAVIGEGTRFTIRLPLSLAIFNGMVVKVSNNFYIIPNSDVERVLPLPLNAGRFISSSKERVIEIDGTVMALVDLREKLSTHSSHEKAHSMKPSNSNGILIVTRAGHHYHAVIVDEILAQQRIVHKSLGQEVSHLKGVTGATILGDGKAALILDISAWRLPLVGVA